MLIYGRENANGDFPCAKLVNAKKIAKVFFTIMKKNGTSIDYTCLALPLYQIWWL